MAGAVPKPCHAPTMGGGLVIFVGEPLCIGGVHPQFLPQLKLILSPDLVSLVGQFILSTDHQCYYERPLYHLHYTPV